MTDRQLRRLALYVPLLAVGAWGCAQIALALPLPWLMQAGGIAAMAVCLAASVVWAVRG